MSHPHLTPPAKSERQATHGIIVAAAIAVPIFVGLFLDGRII